MVSEGNKHSIRIAESVGKDTTESSDNGEIWYQDY